MPTSSTKSRQLISATHSASSASVATSSTRAQPCREALTQKSRASAQSIAPMQASTLIFG